MSKKKKKPGKIKLLVPPKIPVGHVDFSTHVVSAAEAEVFLQTAKENICCELLGPPTPSFGPVFMTNPVAPTTGRMACTEPNLSNVPKTIDYAKVEKQILASLVWPECPDFEPKPPSIEKVKGGMKAVAKLVETVKVPMEHMADAMGCAAKVFDEAFAKYTKLDAIMTEKFMKASVDAFNKENGWDVVPMWDSISPPVARETGITDVGYSALVRYGVRLKG